MQNFRRKWIFMQTSDFIFVNKRLLKKLTVYNQKHVLYFHFLKLIPFIWESMGFRLWLGPYQALKPMLSGCDMLEFATWNPCFQTVIWCLSPSYVIVVYLYRNVACYLMSLLHLIKYNRMGGLWNVDRIVLLTNFQLCHVKSVTWHNWHTFRNL